MALNDVEHVEAVALINGIPAHAPTLPPEIRAGADGWLAEHHPPPTAYMAAMRSLAGPEDACKRCKGRKRVVRPGVDPGNPNVKMAARWNDDAYTMPCPDCLAEDAEEEPSCVYCAGKRTIEAGPSGATYSVPCPSCSESQEERDA